LEEALEIARADGVDVADDEFVVMLARAHQLPEDTYARYLAPVPREGLVPLSSMKTKDDKKFGVLLSPSILESDDAIVAVLAHEVYEARALEAEFLASGGQLTGKRLHFLVNENTGVLHCQAWDHADELVRRRHGSRDG
jgi:hypothetical protein